MRRSAHLMTAARPAVGGHSPRRILIVEDDRKRATLIRKALEPAYACREVHSADQAFQATNDGAWFAALVDYDLKPGGSGLEVLQALRERSDHTLRVLYSIYYNEGLVKDAQRLAHAHAVIDARRRDFLDSIRRTLGEMIARPRQGEHVQRRAGRAPEPAWCPRSDRIRAFVVELKKAAESDRAVFLYGEPGSGRRLAAMTLRRWRAAWKQRRPAGRRGVGRQAPPAVIEVPALRDRPQDIPYLAESILGAQDAGQAGRPRRLMAPALDEIMRRPWYGNISELREVLMRALQRAGTREALELADLPADIVPARPADQIAKDEGQRALLLRQLRAAGSIRRAAELAGMTRPNYKKLMNRLGILRADRVTREDR